MKRSLLTGFAFLPLAARGTSVHIYWSENMYWGEVRSRQWTGRIFVNTTPWSSINNNGLWRKTSEVALMLNKVGSWWLFGRAPRRTSLTFSRTMLQWRSNALTLARSFLLFLQLIRICVWFLTDNCNTESGPVLNSSSSSLRSSSSFISLFGFALLFLWRRVDWEGRRRRITR